VPHICVPRLIWGLNILCNRVITCYVWFSKNMLQGQYIIQTNALLYKKAITSHCLLGCTLHNHYLQAEVLSPHCYDRTIEKQEANFILQSCFLFFSFFKI